MRVMEGWWWVSLCACMYVHVQVCHFGSVLTISVPGASTPFLPMGCPAPMTSTWPLVTSSCTCRLQRVKALLLSWLKGPNPEIKLHLHVTTLNQMHMFEYWPPGNGTPSILSPFRMQRGQCTVQHGVVERPLIRTWRQRVVHENHGAQLKIKKKLTWATS